MNSIKKIALVGGVLVTSSALLLSFTGDNEGKDKKKKYQIIHVSNGETVTYDTIVDMSSSYTPEQFVADKGISSDNLEIVKIPNMDGIQSEMKTVVHSMEDMEFELERTGEELEKVIKMHLDSKEFGESDEEVQISIEIDDDGNRSIKKTVNGEEVEITEEELNDFQIMQLEDAGDMEKVIKMHIDSKELGESDEKVQISIEVNDEGNRTITKTINGEEVEVTEEELNDFQIMQLEEAGDIQLILESVINEELTEKLEALQIELESIMEELEEGDKSVKVITKHIEIDSDHESDFEWESTDGEHEIKVLTMGNSGDHTIVLVTENYDESDANVSFENSNKELDIYPNPNDGTFKIRYNSDDKKKTSITVTDASGKKVFNEDLGKFSGSYEKEINLKEFGSGMYTVTIESGNDTEVQKVMIN
ncbi:MAG: T9SS type A sorting domain-containing protein [Crocinitomicaceae bacterium]